MRKNTAIRERKRKLDDKHDEDSDYSLSQSNSSSSSSSSFENTVLSTKYFNDTIPEETVRSTLPSELAEEYLSFIQQCGKRRKKNIAPNQQQENPVKKLAQIPSSGENNKPKADHKENLPVPKVSEKSANAKDGVRKGRRRKNTSTNLLICLLCSIEFPTKREKQEHYNQHLGPRGYECTYCEKCFDKMPALVSHASRIHLINKKLVCKICGKKFRREWLLKSHSLTHTSGRKFSCPTCKMGFTHKRHLFEHISGHVGFNPYKCEECGKRFQKSSYLSLHRKRHVDVRPFQCNMCNVRCCSYSAFEIHKMLHTGTAGFECEECNVKIPFNSKSSHLISHNRKKSWSCDLCPAKFHAESSLKSHLKAHACKKEHKCDVCGIALKTASDCCKHVCPKWKGVISVAQCKICNLLVKKSLLKDHYALCSGKRSTVNSNKCLDENDDEFWDMFAESNNTGDELSSASEETTDESDVDDVSEVDGNSGGRSALGAVWNSESLYLDLGLVQKNQQGECEVEEDTEDENSQDSSVSGAIGRNESLDLDCGVVQKIAQGECECEEDADNENSQDSSGSGAIGRNESLDLDCGVVQKVAQGECEVEEDTDDDNSQDN